MGAKIGSRVAYRIDEVERWIEDHTFKSTTHETVATEERGRSSTTE